MTEIHNVHFPAIIGFEAKCRRT